MESTAVKHTAEVNGIIMDYFTFGSGGKTLVILPGLDINSVLDYADSIAAAYSMFAEDYTVYVFDRRRNISAGYTVRDMADDTAQVMMSLGIEDAYIFGASQGGMMAQWMMVDFPGLVRAAVLGSTLSRINDNAAEVLRRWISCAESHDIKSLNQSFGEYLYSEQIFEMFRDKILSANAGVTDKDFERFILLSRACEDFCTYDRLGEIKCPVLVIGAEADKVVTGEASVEIAEKLGCELFMYGNGYGHCVYDEAHDYKKRLLDFFGRN